MQLEDYFEFEKFDTKFGVAERIRIKGHRISIEHVIQLYNAGMVPDEIQREYPSLSREQVYATITYYLHNKSEVDAYIERGEKIADAFYQEHLQQEPAPVVKRLLELKARQQKAFRMPHTETKKLEEKGIQLLDDEPWIAEPLS